MLISFSLKSFFTLGFATSAPPFTVAPITIPAEISTQFFMMYWPKSVGTNKVSVHVSSLKIISGRHAPIIWKYRRNNVRGIHLWSINPTPIIHSSEPKIPMAIRGGIFPNVSQVMVLVAISSASLTPGKNFTNPNQKKIIPNDQRKIIKPFRAFQFAKYWSCWLKKMLI